jgi:outer membrane protein OmpA-like peptidoglycan-associated protein
MGAGIAGTTGADCVGGSGGEPDSWRLNLNGPWGNPMLDGLELLSPELERRTAEGLPPAHEIAALPASMGLDRFAFGSAALSPHHLRLIDRIARRVAASWRGPDPIRAIRLTGHADSRGPAAYNLKLGQRRALAVQAALVRAIERLRRNLAKQIHFATQSLGAAHPVASNQTTEGRARNRRVAIWLNPPPHDPGPASASREQAGERMMEAPAASSPAPSLLYSESTLPSETHYVTITHGQEAPASPMTGIFIPDKYQIPSQIDMILYLHGHHKGGAWPTRLSIDIYWNVAHYPYWGLREGVNVSRKNVILAAPTLGPASEAGKLKDPGGSPGTWIRLWRRCGRTAHSDR